jgi:nucleotide-binding universal stress UspA family protein
MSYKILFPVDGSEGSLKAAHHVAHMAAMMPGCEVHLLNVQPLGDDWMVRRMIKAEELAALEAEWGEASLAPARSLLQQAGIPCLSHMLQGEVAATVVRLAKELGCDQIMMGTQGRSALGDLLLGSVAVKVLHLSSVPVTLVKP